MYKFIKNFVLKRFRYNHELMRILYWLRYKLFVIPRLRRQLSVRPLDKSALNSGIKRKILFPLIETSHYQYYQLLIIAKSLEIRGESVKILICGQSLDGCELKSFRNEKDTDPCWRCRFNERSILPLFELEVVRIKDILSSSEIDSIGLEAAELISEGSKEVMRHGIQLKQSIEDSVIRYFYGATPDNNKYVNSIRQAHTKTALMSAEIAHRIDVEWGPNVVISNMPCYSAWEPYYRYYRNNKNRFSQISMSAFNFNSIVYNSFDLFPAERRFHQYVKWRRNNTLNGNEREALQEFISKRTLGEADLFVENKYFSAVGRPDEIKEKLKYDKTKRNIFLFSNLYWDVGLSERGGLFVGVLDWVMNTIELVKDNKKCHLYIKPHPAEFFGSAGSLKGVSQFFKEQYPEGVSNVTIIDPELKFNTYHLFPLIDVGVIFTGTIGLEMMLAGIPVISTGETSHKRLNLAAEPSSLEDYKLYLLGEKSFPVVSFELLELFSYFYFIRTLIPWHLTKQVYNDDFDGFSINSLNELLPGHDSFLDHLCNCIVDSHNTIPEAWSQLEKDDFK